MNKNFPDTTTRIFRSNVDGITSEIKTLSNNNKKIEEYKLLTKLKIVNYKFNKIRVII